MAKFPITISQLAEAFTKLTPYRQVNQTTVQVDIPHPFAEERTLGMLIDFDWDLSLGRWVLNTDVWKVIAD